MANCEEDVIRQLLEAVPELRIPYEQEAQDWQEEGLSPFLTFDLVVTPWLDERIKRSDALDAVRRLFDVFESALMNRVAEVRELVQPSTLEYIAGTPSVFEATLPMMGPRTKNVVIEMRDWRPDSIPSQKRWWRIWKRA
jgi:hypothetical protein